MLCLVISCSDRLIAQHRSCRQVAARSSRLCGISICEDAWWIVIWLLGEVVFWLNLALAASITPEDCPGLCKDKQLDCSGQILDLNEVFEDSETRVVCKARFTGKEPLAITRVKQYLLEASQLDCHGHDADFFFPVLLLLIANAFVALNCDLSLAALVWYPTDERFHAALIGDGIDFVDVQIDAAFFEQINVLRVVQLSPNFGSPQMRRINYNGMEPCFL
jgi:hypothetical protein